MEKIRKSRSTVDLPCFLSSSLFNSVISDMINTECAHLIMMLYEDCVRKTSELINYSLNSEIFNRFPYLKSNIEEKLDAFTHSLHGFAKNELRKIIEKESTRSPTIIICLKTLLEIDNLI
jgi:hypothetical protein